MLGTEVTLSLLEADPYPVFASLQEHEPVAFGPSLDTWLVTRWDDVVLVCERPELFCSNTEPSWLRDCLGQSMLTLERREGAHLAFAAGEHRCLREWLGRQQVRSPSTGCSTDSRTWNSLSPSKFSGSSSAGHWPYTYDSPKGTSHAQIDRRLSVQ